MPGARLERPAYLRLEGNVAVPAVHWPIVTTYLAFLRAINVGGNRTFSMADVTAATEAAGGTAVATYLNTGNVRLDSPLPPAALKTVLEEAYAARSGFAVPTVLLTPAQVAAIAARGAELAAGQAPAGKQYITVYAVPPAPEAAAAVHALAIPGEQCVVEERAAYALLDGDIHSAKLFRSKEFRALGEGTARTHKVLTTLTAKWC